MQRRQTFLAPEIPPALAPVHDPGWRRTRLSQRYTGRWAAIAEYFPALGEAKPDHAIQVIGCRSASEALEQLSAEVLRYSMTTQWTKIGSDLRKFIKRGAT